MLQTLTDAVNVDHRTVIVDRRNRRASPPAETTTSALPLRDEGGSLPRGAQFLPLCRSVNRSAPRVFVTLNVWFVTGGPAYAQTTVSVPDTSHTTVPTARVGEPWTFDSIGS